MRKPLFAVLMTLLLLPSAGLAADVCGDVNQSKTVTSSDSLLVLKAAVGTPVTLICPSIAGLEACTTALESSTSGACATDLATCTVNLSQGLSGTASLGDVLNGKTFTSAVGLGATGTMINRGAVSILPGPFAKTIAAGYHNGAGTVVGDTDLVGSNIRSGIDVFGVMGAAPLATGTATAGNVLAGSTFSNASSASLTGTMANNGALTLTPATSDQVIPAGYHNGAGKCTGDADLVATKILSGVNLFGVNGSMIQATGAATAGNVLAGSTFSNALGAGTGAMPNIGAVSITPGTTAQTIAAGYHNGSGTVAGDTDLVAGNVKSGVGLFGVTGSVIASTGTAPAGNVLAGSTFSNASSASLTGTMANNGAVSITPGTLVKTIAAGYHNGSGTVAGDTDLVAGNIVSGTNIFGVTGSATVGSVTITNGLLQTGQTTSYGTGSDGALQKGTARSFTDNGNGTITDNRTGLMWEKKSDNGDIHDKDHTYSVNARRSPLPVAS